MKTVFHPTLPATQEVPDEDLESWVEQGWRKTQPKAVADSPDATTPDTKGPKS